VLQTLIATYLAPLALAACLCAGVAVFERWRPAGQDAGLGGRLYNFRLYAISFFSLAALSPWLGAIAGRLGGAGWLPAVAAPDSWLGLIGNTLLYAVVWDFFQYWAHRLQHRVPALWALHRVHHHDAAFGASTALRQSVGSLVFHFFFVHLPTLAVCGTGFLPAIGAAILFNGWGFFNHANVRLSLGPLTPVVSGPQWHRLHHGMETAYHDRNFAAFFPVLDLIFGTYRAPGPAEYPQTGVAGAVPSRSSFREAFTPLLSLLPQRPAQGAAPGGASREMS
jgi:sterol desaturase/sphingolipid hydroxylase (fatty acid hydroxylase superfamily)